MRPTVETFVEQIVGMVEFLGEDAVAIGTDLPAIAGSTGDTGLSKSELARRGATVQAKLDQSLSRFPAIFADYTSNFENKLETRYCAGFDSLARWSELHGHLEHAGMSDTAIEKNLGSQLDTGVSRGVECTEPVARLKEQVENMNSTQKAEATISDRVLEQLNRETAEARGLPNQAFTQQRIPRSRKSVRFFRRLGFCRGRERCTELR